MTSGYIIRVSTLRDGKQGLEEERYQVAIDDENEAKRAIREAADSSDAVVDTTGKLRQADIIELGLIPGEVRRVK